MHQSPCELYLGDCLEVMAKLPAASVDMIAADLPYGTTQNKWDSIIPLAPLWAQYWRVLKSNGAVVLTAQCPFDKTLGVSCLEHLKYEWIWRKEAGTGFLNAKFAPLKDHENALVFYREKPTYNPQMRTGFKPYTISKGGDTTNYRPGLSENVVTKSNGERYPVTTIEFSRDRDKLHPTQKPVALFEYLIRTYTNPGDVVLDNTMGSGTTGVAAINTGRRFRGIERDPDYFQIACRRVAEAQARVSERLAPAVAELQARLQKVAA